MRDVKEDEKSDSFDDVGRRLMHSTLSPPGRIWHVSFALDFRAAIFPKLLIAALCWIGMFLQQIEACSPDAFRRAPAVSENRLDYLAAPDLKDFSGNLVHAASRVTSTFDFDSGGNRARQTKERIAANDSRVIEYTLYLGSYEREIHQTKVDGSSPAVLAKTVHRHSLGGGVIYTKTVGTTGPVVRLSNVLADHLGSTDVILTGTWNGSTFANHTTERQSFDAWGERRAADTQVNFRATDSDAFRTSAQDHDRGYTGHEQMDDSGLIHMNGRIYDPELGRFLAPDPYVQIPEYSQNFNRYSYVLNNPLNATDPSGFSFVSKLFHKKMDFIKENWRTIVVIVVAVIAWYYAPAILGAFGAPTSITATGSAATAGGLAAQGAVAGSIVGGFNSAIHGGDLGDVLRGAVVGGIQGAISGGVLHQWGVNAADAGLFSADSALHISGHGVVGGAANEAMGGKFADGFFSAAASAAAGNAGLLGDPDATGPTAVVSRTVRASVVGGTVSVIGGGKFANGAYTAAFQHLLNAEARTKWRKPASQNPHPDFAKDSFQMLVYDWEDPIAGNHLAEAATMIPGGKFLKLGRLAKFLGFAPKSTGPKPLLGKNPTLGKNKNRTNTELEGGKATAKSIFRNQTKGQKVEQFDLGPKGGVRRVSEHGTQIRIPNNGGGARVDLPGRGSAGRETIHFDP